MGIVLSVLTCGVFSRVTGGDELGATAYQAARLVTGARSREIEEQRRFAELTRVQQALEKRELDCTEMKQRIDDMRRRALRHAAVLKQQPPASADVQKRASNEARALLRGKRALEVELQRKLKMIDVASRTLAATNAVRDTDADRELMADLASLSRQFKINDSDISAITEAGIEVIDNAAELEQHQEEINTAILSLNEDSSDKGSAFDLNHDESLLAALDELQAEVDNEKKQTGGSSRPMKATPPDNDNDVQSETLFATPDVPSGAPQSALLYDWSPNTPTAKTAPWSPSTPTAKAPPQRVAIAETTTGRFMQTDASTGAAKRREKPTPLEFF